MTPSRPSHTAEAVCFMRAVDRVGRHAPRVIDDPYAALFLSLPAKALLATVARADDLVGLRPIPLGPLTRFVHVRHRWMDEQLLGALPDVGQVVVLGAGYDMRAYRFAAAIGARPVFEVDYPSTRARKAAILARHAEELPAVDVRRVAIDFQTETLPEVLEKAGFDPAVPSFVTWEGVSMYLDRPAIEGTLTTLRTLGATDLVMDFWSGERPSGVLGAIQGASPGFFAALAEPLTFSVAPDAVGALLAGVGWRVESIVTGEELGTRYGTGWIWPGVYCVRARATAIDPRDEPGLLER